jgi:thiamine-monophosphate kinase
LRLGEFDIISTYFKNVGCWPTSLKAPATPKEVGDDCAVVSVPEGYRLCFSMDTLVSGVHFPENISPSQLASRALAITISDLAAMGAIPWCFTLSLTLPEADSDWLQNFSHQLDHDAREYNIRLVGGDMTKGPLSMTFQVHGLLPEGEGLYRHLAKPGDIICVTGNLGDAAGALAFLDAARYDSQQNKDAVKQLLNAYYSPTPQIELGRAVAGFACSAIDVSDGFFS